ncbi:MAG TPA: type II secretion system protein, partial [Woeseiaceae bacterium]|nr:type II secretion system protein [Woeseiaceae bacterium]
PARQPLEFPGRMRASSRITLKSLPEGIDFRSENMLAQRGFSLLELVVAIVVLGLIFSGFVSVYGTVLKRGAEPQLWRPLSRICPSLLMAITGRKRRATFSISLRPTSASTC